MRVVGINGFKRSGKGACGEILARKYDGNVKLVGFADNLKIMGAKSLGVEGSDAELIAYMDEFKQRGWITYGCYPGSSEVTTGRQYLQQFGGRAREVFGEDFWINQVLPQPIQHTPGMDRLDHDLANRRRLQVLHPEIDVLVITDLRYPNEAARVHALGGTIWSVVRPGVESDGHASEQPLPTSMVDWYIGNDSDLAGLESAVDEAMWETLSEKHYA